MAKKATAAKLNSNSKVKAASGKTSATASKQKKSSPPKTVAEKVAKAPAKKQVNKEAAPAKNSQKNQPSADSTVENVAPSLGKNVGTPPAKEKKSKSKSAETKAEQIKALADSEDLKKWNDLKDKFGREKAPTYAMTEAFPAPSPIQHKVLGWGYILGNTNDRLEVLFESGRKVLISNYKKI